MKTKLRFAVVLSLFCLTVSGQAALTQQGLSSPVNCLVHIADRDVKIVYPQDAEGRAITVAETFSEEGLAVLRNVTYGTTGPLYQHRDVGVGPEKSTGKPYKFELYLNGKVVGTFALYRSRVWVEYHTVDMFYRTALAIDSAYQGSGLGKFFTSKVYKYAYSLLESPGLLVGYVEADNDRSLAMARHNRAYEIGTFSSLFYYREKLKSTEYTQLTDSEREEMLLLLRQQDHTHALRDYEVSLIPSRYFVVKDQDGKILAGAQIQHHHWSVKRLPGGIVGKAMLKIFPRVKFLRERFNPEDYQFLQFGSLYARHGHEHRLVELLDSLLARHEMRSGLIFMDRRSKIFRRLNAQGVFGRMNQALESQVKLMALQKGMWGETLADILRGPVHVSIGNQD